ncbi:MBL fold metallo-hydrolase [Novosphingobium sp. YAF33]|uniref:MBL fold metallo-hydrolase n=1 Tax=Novosphingobium sp. YAF33 TaxID=3233082 RepID=UPI003F9A96AE
MLDKEASRAPARRRRIAFAAVFTLFAGLPCAGQAAPASGAQWVTLGTSGGPAIQAERSQIANALVVNGAVYLFDVGDGTQRQMAKAGIPERQIRAIFISHHHPDHNASLGSLMMTHWTFHPGDLPVIGPAGTIHLVEGLADANAPSVLASYPTAGPAKPPLAGMLKARDLPEHLSQPTLVFEDANIKVWAIGVDHFQSPPSIILDHMPDCVAYRVEAGGRTFAFTGDSGPSSRLGVLAKGADVLVSEIVEPLAIAARIRASAPDTPAPVREAIIAGMTRNHLTPEEVGKLAESAGVGEVVLTHFVPSPEEAADRGAYTRPISARFKGKVIMAGDLDRF